MAADFTQSRLFVSPATGTASASFPGADLLYVQGGVEYYLNVTSQVVEVLGTYRPDPVGLGVIAAISNAPPIVEQRAPVNFFDINQVSSGVLFPFLPSQIDPVLFAQLPFTADSMRIRTSITRLDVVDGWGNVTIPGGTFPVLREKRTTYTERRLDAKIPPLGWLDVTDNVIQSLNLNTLGVDTTVAYYFFNNISKEPIVILTLDNAQSNVISAQYKRNTVIGSPPIISNIEDGDADNMVSAGTLLTYTVTFNEDINAITVTAADFNNAGTATTSIGTISETSPGVFTVQVTPTTAGTLTLRVPSGAVIADLDGNNLVVPVLDDTTLTVLPLPIVGDADSSDQAIGAVIDQFLMQTQNPPEIFDPCTCRNNTGVIPNGTSTDDGLFDDEIIVISPTAGDTWEIANEMGSVFPFATNANPLAQPGDLTRVAPGAPLLFIGSVNTMNGIRYIYRLQIIHKDNEGYSVSVRETSNPAYAALVLPISNRCYYPTPAINGLDATYCVEEPAVTLMGTVDRGDGQMAATPASAVFSINNNPITQFNPQTLGAGAFTVVYTIAAAEEGETIPGCVQAVSQQVQVGAEITINPLLPQTTCSTRNVALADVFKGVVYAGNPAELRYTWAIKETGNLNGVLEGLDETNPAAGTYTPGKDAGSRGFVTLVLTVDNPNDACAAESAEVRITIAKTDCGDFPWSGKE